jgi:hypothetical protein
MREFPGKRKFEKPTLPLRGADSFQMSIDGKTVTRRPAGMPPHQRRRQAECVESGTEITPFLSIHNKENHFGHTVSR